MDKLDQMIADALATNDRLLSSLHASLAFAQSIKNDPCMNVVLPPASAPLHTPKIEIDVVLPEKEELPIEDDILMTEVEVQELTVDVRIDPKKYTQAASTIVLKTLPMFLPEGTPLNAERKPFQEVTRYDPSVKMIFDANYHGAMERGWSIHDSSLIANIRAYAHKIGIPLDTGSPLKPQYRAPKVVQINMSDRASYFHEYRESAEHAAIFKKSYKWFQMYAVFFLCDSPTYDPSKEKELIECHRQIFGCDPGDIYDDMLILFTGLLPYRSRDIHRFAHFCRKKYDAGTEVDSYFMSRMAKVLFLDPQSLPGMEYRDPDGSPRRHELKREILFDDGSVKLILLHSAAVDDDDPYKAFLDEDLKDFPESNNVKENFRKRRHLPRFYQFQRPRMSVYYNSAFYGSYDYSTQKMTIAESFNDVRAHLRRLENDSIHFYDPVYNSIEDIANQ